MHSEKHYSSFLPESYQVLLQNKYLQSSMVKTYFKTLFMPAFYNYSFKNQLAHHHPRVNANGGLYLRLAQLVLWTVTQVE